MDNLCNWEVTDDTPVNAIEEWFLMNFRSIKPERSNFEWPVIKWVESGDYKDAYWKYWNIITSYSPRICKREWKGKIIIKNSITNSNLVIWRNDIKIWFKWDREIKKMQILIWDESIKTIDILNKKKKLLKVPIFIPFKFLNIKNILKIRLIDIEWYTYDENIDVKILDRDINK
jgi:hypothetical protein